MVRQNLHTLRTTTHVVGRMRLRIKLSISINEPAPESHATPGPDVEAQIGHLESTGYVDTGMGFVPPGPKVDEAFE
jgi:hypothetical protein